MSSRLLNCSVGWTHPSSAGSCPLWHTTAPAAPVLSHSSARLDLEGLAPGRFWSLRGLLCSFVLLRRPAPHALTLAGAPPNQISPLKLYHARRLKCFLAIGRPGAPMLATLLQSAALELSATLVPASGQVLRLAAPDIDRRAPPPFQCSAASPLLWCPAARVSRAPLFWSSPTLMLALRSGAQQSAAPVLRPLLRLGHSCARSPASPLDPSSARPLRSADLSHARFSVALVLSGCDCSTAPVLDCSARSFLSSAAPALGPS